MDIQTQILEDLKVKGLFLVGGKGSGKTVMGKYLLNLARERWGDLVDIRCFDHVSSSLQTKRKSPRLPQEGKRWLLPR